MKCFTKYDQIRVITGFKSQLFNLKAAKNTEQQTLDITLASPGGPVHP